ncbi:DMT family transporter [Pacificispira sp.]|uniref:DMT family transporter n=1 Tax=Pacificispira sp. TaxID=2888761 RepID=UPI003B518FEB
MGRADFAFALLVPFLWGFQFVVIKVGLADFPPLFFLGLRFVVIAALMLPFVGIPTARELGPMIAVSVFLGGLNFGLVYSGLAHGQAGISAVVFQLQTPFTVLLAWPLLGDRPLPRVVLGVGIAFAGVALTVAAPENPVVLYPVLLVLGAALAMAIGNVAVKRFGPFEPLKLMAWISLFTVPQVWAMSALVEQGQYASLFVATPTAWLAFAYTVLLGGIAGFGLWFRLIAKHSMSRIAPFGLLQTAFAIASGVLLLQEPLTERLIMGALICVCGVAITQGRGRAPTPAVPPPPAPALGATAEPPSLRRAFFRAKRR